MANQKTKETFGCSDPGQVQSPMSFQLNGQGTPEYPCDLLPEYHEKELMPIPDPLKLSKGGNK